MFSTFPITNFNFSFTCYPEWDLPFKRSIDTCVVKKEENDSWQVNFSFSDNFSKACTLVKTRDFFVKAEISPSSKLKDFADDNFYI